MPQIVEWTVDYGDGRETVQATVPHAWRQDVSVQFEGPVFYRTLVDVPREPSHLHFEGVSYACKVLLDGELVGEHLGIWDAFDVPLDRFAGRSVQVEVQVVKNGGATYPVKEVASGFLPYVYHTFGGIFGNVHLRPGLSTPLPQPFDASTRYRVDGAKIYVDGDPFYIRGLLTWGWYPEIGHTNPPEEIIRRDVVQAKALGFNLIKFCLWVPSHRYLEIMREHGMEAWIELPLWDPTDDPVKQSQIGAEIETIVRQYRHHPNVLVWTVGCELSSSTRPEYRRQLTDLVQALTNNPLVKDNSGGAEMYGGDLREFGTIYDFHPYCDTHFYGPVLDTLLPGARPTMPILLGEFNDIDVHRDLAELGNQLPYWTSNLDELNHVGVRWQYDLPSVLIESRFSLHPIRERHAQLMESSRQKALFIRKTVHELVRARDAIGGYVITGWKDTPISSSGFFDDWDKPRFSLEECRPWNSEDCIFLIPIRRPPWVDGGNRPGYLDPVNFFTGQLFWRIGIHSEQGTENRLVWRLRRSDGSTFASGIGDPVRVPALESHELAQISVHCEEPGEYCLEVECGRASNAWDIWVVPKEGATWRAEGDPSFVPSNEEGACLVTASVPNRIGDKAVVVLSSDGTRRMPFWREAAYEFRNDDFWTAVPFRERWERLLPVSGDRAIDPQWLSSLGDAEVLMNRIDSRTYREHPVIARIGNTVFTTLRPQGGLGSQPTSLSVNPAGMQLLRSLSML